MDIEGPALNGRVGCLDSGNRLQDVDDCPTRLVEVVVDVDIDPTSEFHPFKGLDPRQLPEVFVAAAGVDAGDRGEGIVRRTARSCRGLLRGRLLRIRIL